jgi:hypothetical protein
MLTREQLLGSFQRRYRTVETPLGEVRIQNLNEGEKSLWQDANYDKDGRLVANWLSKSRRRLVAACLVDEAGNRILQAADAEQLKTVDAGIIAAIADACSDHIGLPLAEAKELEKNSDGAHADGSPTA